VGAPYEENGVVYVYHGSTDGIKQMPAQIIQAKVIDQRIKGFGISLSKGVDIDGNHYNGKYCHACWVNDNNLAVRSSVVSCTEFCITGNVQSEQAELTCS
jgi:hypothetical protein